VYPEVRQYRVPERTNNAVLSQKSEKNKFLLAYHVVVL